jgi:uncharacterized membrane protein YjjP (DUF1212 family)
MAFGSGRHWNHYNFFICWVVSLGQLAFGYPASIIGVTLAQPSFLVYSKEPLDTCSLSLIDSSLVGLLDVTTTPPSLTGNANQLIGACSGVFQVR